MAITRQSDRRKGIRRRRNRRKGDIDIKIVRIEGDGRQEETVRHGPVSQRKEISIGGWHEEFALAWSEAFITK